MYNYNSACCLYYYNRVFYSGVGRDGTRYECQFELRNEVIPQVSYLAVL